MDRIKTDPAMKAYRPESSTVSTKTRFSWPIVVALITLAFGAGGAAVRAQVAGADAGQALKENNVQDAAIQAHEVRIVRLEEERKADQAVLQQAVDALKENSKTLTAVQLELAKRK